MNDKNNGIKFYSTHDLSISYNLEKIESILNNYDECETYSINDYLEHYNLLCFFDEKLYSKTWDENKLNGYLDKCKIIKKNLSIYINSIDENNFEEIYSKVSRLYKDDFWKLFDKYKIFNKISKTYFIEFIKKNDIHPYEIMQYEAIINYYDDVLSEYYYNDVRLAELLVRKYIEKKNDSETNYYFPTGINNKEIITNYISDDESNINYLRVIATDGKCINGINDDICYDARNKAKELSDKFFSDNSGFKYGVEISFSEDQKDPIIIGSRDGIILLSYSSNYLLRDKNIKTLIIDNFFNVFEFVDFQSRFKHIHKVSQSGVFERIVGVHAEKEYTRNIVFEIDQMTAQAQIVGYYDTLLKNNIYLEELIKEYFEDYIVKKYGIQGFVFNSSRIDDTYLSKCKNIISEMEGILKQFKCYVEHGKVDAGLINFSSTPVPMDNVPSLLANKYLYPFGDDFKKASFLLFSDQSMLNYSIKTKKSYQNFIEYTLKENLKMNEIAPYNVNDVNWLIDLGVCYIDNDENIKCNALCLIIKQLYDNECVTYIAFRDNEKTDYLIRKGLCKIGESTLFSKPETDYLSFLLNKEKFNNGYDIRNKYSHGSIILTEQQHKDNYFVLLRLMILIILKIDYEFIMNIAINNAS